MLPLSLLAHCIKAARAEGIVVGLVLRRIDARFQISDATSRVLVTKRWKIDMVAKSRGLEQKLENGCDRAPSIYYYVVVSRHLSLLYRGVREQADSGPDLCQILAIRHFTQKSWPTCTSDKNVGQVAQVRQDLAKLAQICSPAQVARKAAAHTNSKALDFDMKLVCRSKWGTSFGSMDHIRVAVGLTSKYSEKT